jgi:hypothetical protein
MAAGDPEVEAVTLNDRHVEVATTSWVHWWNTRSPPSTIRYVPLAEHASYCTREQVSTSR